MSMPRTALVLVFVGAALVALTAFGQQGTPDEAEPRPFDPLSDGEQERATTITLSNATVNQTLSNRTEVIGATLYTDKAFQERDPWPRMAETWVFDYEANRALRALVSLDTDEVTELDTPTFQPPLTASEAERVGNQALDDEEVEDRLEAAGVEAPDWTARLWTGPGPTACPEHRCALVAFLDGERYVWEFAVVVDLVDDAVREVLEHAPERPEVSP